MDWKCSVPDKNRKDKNIRIFFFFTEERTAFLLSTIFSSFIYTLQEKQNVFAFNIYAYALIVPQFFNRQCTTT